MWKRRNFNKEKNNKNEKFRKGETSNKALERDSNMSIRYALNHIVAETASHSPATRLRTPLVRPARHWQTPSVWPPRPLVLRSWNTSRVLMISRDTKRE